MQHRAYKLSILASALLASSTQAQLGAHRQLASSSTHGASALRNLHLFGERAQILKEGFALFGIQVVMVSPLRADGGPLRIDIDDADLSTAGSVLGAMTHCFFVPIDSNLVLAVPDNKANRTKFESLDRETLIVPDRLTRTTQDRTAIDQMLTTVFDAAKPSVAGGKTLIYTSPMLREQIKDVLISLDKPRPQVILAVKTYLITRTHDRNMGVQLPQSFVVFNVYAEAKSLITSNSSIVEELIEAGLVTASDTLGIAELLIADGYAGSSVLGSSSLYFGGGKTAMGVQFDSVNANATLSDSSTQELQEAKLQLADGQMGKLLVGEHYPVLTATTSAVGSASSSTSTPSIQYEDLGLMLEATPHLMAQQEVLVHLHETIRSLSGSSLNTIPIVDNQEIATDLTVPDGVTTVVVSNISYTDALAMQGIIDSVITNRSRDLTDSQLVITITPIVTR